MSGADIRKFTFLKGLKIDEFEGFGVQGEVHQIPRGEIRDWSLPDFNINRLDLLKCYEVVN